MPDLMSAAFFERDGALLVAHRSVAPFAGQWVAPMTVVGANEAAEDALRRELTSEFGITPAAEPSFLDTVYLTDPDDQRQYVANVFRSQLGDAPLRFRTGGAYDDARWLRAADLEQVWMPPELRASLVRALTDPGGTPVTDWSGAGAQATPLGEQAPAAAPDGPAPDNRGAWAAIAPSYQKEHAAFDPRRLRWSRGLYEDELHVLDDVRGKRALVLGSGTGHDVVALAAMGARTVGVDVVPEQVECGRRLAARTGVDNASFVVADLVDLARLDDASFDLAISIHALDFVEDAAAALGEASRVLRPGGALAVAVLHPWNQLFAGGAPYRAARSYWTPFVDDNWDEGTLGDAGRYRTFQRTIEAWCRLLDAAGFALARLLEPYQGDIDEAERDGFDMERAQLMPQVLIMKARKR